MKNKKKQQYIVDDKGKPVAVVIDMKTYKKMEDALDAYYCRKEYDRVKPLTDSEIRNGKFLTIDEFNEKRKKVHHRATA